MNATTAPSPAQKDTASILDGIANSFWTFKRNIGKSSMVCQVPAGHKPAIIAKLARAGNNMADANFSVPVFGKVHHQTFLKLVVAPRAAIGTYLDQHTLTFAPHTTAGNRCGDRLIPVERYTEISVKLREMTAYADEQFEVFMRDYDDYIEDGRRAANAMFDGFGIGDQFRADGKLPTAEEFRQRFYIRISEPKPLAVFDIKRYKNASIPVADMNRIAESNFADLRANFEGAKIQALTAAKALADTVITQLTALNGGTRTNDKGVEYSGARLSESLIQKARICATVLGDLNSGYDFDPQIKNAVDVILEKIGSVKDTDAWKTSPTTRAESLRAAKAASKILGAAEKKATKAPVKKPAKLQAGDVMMGTGTF